jgi:hypothetical protein
LLVVGPFCGLKALRTAAFNGPRGLQSAENVSQITVFRQR